MRAGSTDAVVNQDLDLDVDQCPMSRRSSNNVNTAVSAGFEERQSSDEPYPAPRAEEELQDQYNSSATSDPYTYRQSQDGSPTQVRPNIPVRALEHQEDSTEPESSDRERKLSQGRHAVNAPRSRVPTSQARSKLRSEGGLHRLDSQVVAARQSLSRYRDRQYDTEREVDPQLAACDRKMVEVEEDTPRMTVPASPAQEFDQHGAEEEEEPSPNDDHTPRPDFHGRAQPPHESTEEENDDEEEEDEVEHEEDIQSRVEFERLQFPTPQIREEGLGLGVGMTIRSDSIYSLSTPFSGIDDPFPEIQSNTTSFLIPESSSPSVLYTDSCPGMGSCEINEERSPCSTYDAQEGEQGIAYPTQVVRDRNEVQDWGLVEEEEMLCVTDLDTGHRVELPIKQLDELWSL
jgi:hypothetical protein